MSAKEPKLKPEAEKVVREFKEKRQEILQATRAVKSRLSYLDQMAAQFKSQLKELKAQPMTPELQVTIAQMERKLAAYEVIHKACASVEKSLEPMMQDYSVRQIIKAEIKVGTLDWQYAQAETELLVINARILIDSLAPKMRLIQSALGQPIKLARNELAEVNALKVRVNANPELKQRLGQTVGYFQEALGAVTQGEKDLSALRQLSGGESQAFIQRMKPQQISGKLYHLERLHIIYAGDPLLSKYFPAPKEVVIPKTGAPQPTKKSTQPLTGRLLDLFGLGGDKK